MKGLKRVKKVKKLRSSIAEISYGQTVEKQATFYWNCLLKFMHFFGPKLLSLVLHLFKILTLRCWKTDNKLVVLKYPQFWNWLETSRILILKLQELAVLEAKQSFLTKKLYNTTTSIELEHKQMRGKAPVHSTWHETVRSKNRVGELWSRLNDPLLISQRRNIFQWDVWNNKRI